DLGFKPKQHIWLRFFINYYNNCWVGISLPLFQSIVLDIRRNKHLVGPTYF
ncbi:hypothetical protein L9F63_022079, partial [Diploptera punctata]